MVVAIKEHALIDIMQSRCKRENAGIVLLFRPGKADFVLTVSGFTSRTAGYSTRSSGGVAGRSTMGVLSGLLKTTGHRLSPLSAFLEALSTSVKSLSISSF